MNQQLKDKKYKLPLDVLKHLNSALIKYPNGTGVKRAKFLLKNGEITYQSLKRLKNFFDYYDGNNPEQYELAGGDLMKSFVEKSLQSDRDAIKRSDDIKRDINIDPNLGVKAQQNPRLNEIENVNNNLNNNVLGIIVNDDNQILLLKRNPNIDCWQAGKWALAGGTVENNETPEEACKREIKEETGLIINKFKEKFKIERDENNIESIFIIKYDGDPHNIKLNFEHINYGWFLPEDIKFIDHVPNLLDYINIAFKNYDN